MSTFQQIRDGLADAWESITTGWRELRERAGHAITRFHRPAQTEDRQQPVPVRHGARWGLVAAELREDDRFVDVSLEVPGMQPDDFEIEVLDGILRVRGEKHVSRDEQHGHYRLMERAYGSFERAIRLPAPVEDAQAEATYKQGVLTVRLPKRASGSAGRKVSVRSG